MDIMSMGRDPDQEEIDALKQELSDSLIFIMKYLKAENARLEDQVDVLSRKMNDLEAALKAIKESSNHQ